MRTPCESYRFKVKIKLHLYDAMHTYLCSCCLSITFCSSKSIVWLVQVQHMHKKKKLKWPIRNTDTIGCMHWFLLFPKRHHTIGRFMLLREKLKVKMSSLKFVMQYQKMEKYSELFINSDLNRCCVVLISVHRFKWETKCFSLEWQKWILYTQ